MRRRANTGASCAAAVAAALTLTACVGATGATGVTAAGSLQREGAILIRHDPDAFGDTLTMPAEACMRDLWGDEEKVRETAAGQGALGRGTPTTLAALMRDTPRAAPLLAGEQLLCAKPPRPMAVTDLDGDGDLDLMAASAEGQGNQYWLNDGEGSFTGRRYDPLGLGDTYDLEEALQAGRSDFVTADSYVCDLNGDGQGEIITIHGSEDGRLPLTVQDTGPGWPETRTRHIETGANVGEASGATCGDLNGDGHLDIIYTLRSSPIGYEERPGPIRILISRVEEGETLWADESSSRIDDQQRRSRNRPEVAGSSLWGILPFEPRLADLDGDGDLDLMVTADFGAPLLYQNDGGRLLRQETPLDQHYNTMGISAIDIDGDRLLDLMVTDIDLRDISTCPWSVTCPEEHQSPAGHVILLQEEGMRLEVDRESPAAAAFRHNGWGWGFVTIDIDGDGHWDIIQAGGELGVGSENSITWPYRAQPPAVLLGGPEGLANVTRAWAEAWNLPNGSLTITAADMTGDGAPDIIIYGEAVGRPQLYRSSADGDRYAHLHLTSPGTVHLEHPDGRSETFRLPDRHGTFSVTSTAPWPIGIPEGQVHVTVEFDSGSIREHTLRAGETLQVSP